LGKNFYGTVTDELGKVTKMNVVAEGKEQAIEKIMETIWKKDFNRYMRIEKVEVIEGI
jgi:acylphosphatase